MGYLFGIIAVAVLKCLVSKKKPAKSPTPLPKSSSKVKQELSLIPLEGFEKFKWRKTIPKGYKALMNTEVAGTRFRESQTNRFIAGENRNITLERDEGNKHDENAIAVYGHWNGTDKSRIGFIPSENAKIIVDRNFLVDEIPCSLNSIYHPGTDGTPRVYIQLFQKKATKTKTIKPRNKVIPKTTRKTRDCTQCGKRSPVAMTACKHCRSKFGAA